MIEIINMMRIIGLFQIYYFRLIRFLSISTQKTEMLSLFLFSLLSLPHQASADAVISTSFGPVRGIVTSKGERFLGIPFARAPVDDLRWQPPLPPHSWHDIRDAFYFGADCASG